MEARDVSKTATAVPLRPTMPYRVDCLDPVQMPHHGCTPRWGVNFSSMLYRVDGRDIPVDERDFANSVDALVVMVRIDLAAHFA